MQNNIIPKTGLALTPLFISVCLASLLTACGSDHDSNSVTIVEPAKTGVNTLPTGNLLSPSTNIELTHYLKTKKRDSPTRVLDSNETNHQRLASILERLQR